MLRLKQGHPERAVAVYRKVVRARPDDQQAARRLEELEALVTDERGAPMSFREHMQRIVESVPGATACTIMGSDGIAIDTYEVGNTELDVSNLFVELSSTAQQLWRSDSAVEQTGAPQELVIAAERLTAVLRPVTDEYFLGVVLSPSALVGKARFMMRVMTPKIRKELE